MSENIININLKNEFIDYVELIKNKYNISSIQAIKLSILYLIKNKIEDITLDKEELIELLNITKKQRKGINNIIVKDSITDVNKLLDLIKF